MHHIAISIDNNFIKQGITMLNSLNKNNPELTYNLHILDGGISKINKLMLKKFLKNHSIQHHSYKIDYNPIKNAPVTDHVSMATYSRIFLSSILPKNINKVLYLDCDLSVVSNIFDLFETDINNSYLGAIPEVISDNDKKRLGFEKNELYFNAGVALINLQKWREDNIEKKLIDFIINQPEKILYWDQDVLNCCLKGNWKLLSQKFNLTHFYYFPEIYPCDYFNLKSIEYQKLKSEVAIIHFTGKKKPWLKDCNHPMKSEYLKYNMNLWSILTKKKSN